MLNNSKKLKKRLKQNTVCAWTRDVRFGVSR